MDLHVNRSLELLEALTQTASEYSRREEQLTRDLRSRKYTAERQNEEVIERLESALAHNVSETTAQFDAERDRLTHVYESRHARVERSHKVLVRQLPKRVKQARESWLGELQMRRFRLERKLGAEFQSLDGVYKQVSAKVDESRARRKALLELVAKYMRGNGGLKRLINRKIEAATKQPPAPGEVEPHQGLEEIDVNLQAAEEQLAGFRKLFLPRFFSLVPLYIWGPLLLAGAILTPKIFEDADNNTLISIGVGFAIAALVFAILQWIGGMGGKKRASAIGACLAKSVRMELGSLATAEDAKDKAGKVLKQQLEEATGAIRDQGQYAGDVERDFEQKATAKLEAQLPRLLQKIENTRTYRLNWLDSERKSRLSAFKTDADTKISALRQKTAQEVAVIEHEFQSQWQALESDWHQAIEPICKEIAQMNSTMERQTQPWTPSWIDAWNPGHDFPEAAKFGSLSVDLTGRAPKDERLALPCAPQVSVPLSLAFPQQGSLLFESDTAADQEIVNTLNNTILRLLYSTPPGKIAFTIIDPVGLGQNFAGLMHLSDYEESIINRKIWTQRDQIEERLAELSEHIEKVIQMYLRNEYATITEYNAQAGSVAEKYHFLVIADFPATFSEVAARRLQSIVTSGPRCGVFTLIHWDQRQPLPDGFSADEMRESDVCIKREKNRFVLSPLQTSVGAVLRFDPPPSDELAGALVHKIGKGSIDSNRVEVPFSQIAPKPEERWTGDTTSELRVSIGRTGATKLQYLAIGKGTRQHALFAGKTGSGKSTLFHVIITNLALSCSPDQVEFYLIDFKKGVEFKCYAENHLPHARVIAIESDREFGLSVLQRVDEELKRRGDLFRKMGVQDVAGYRRAGGTEPIPRTLLIIDEFQEFFVDDDTIAQGASLLFDRIVRQGRAFGIHVLLGSQTLGGSYSLARATLGQMVIRVALQCNEADAYLIMDENNPAPRLLSRPGEGIYNDAAGAIEGNSPFQVVWLADDDRDEYLEELHKMAAQRSVHFPKPIVFEGNAPADAAENELLMGALHATPEKPPGAARCWLGAPNSIKGPTQATFHRQSGNHLLIVGQREEAAVTMVGLSLLALAAQYPVGTARFYLLHSATPGSQDAAFFESVIGMIPHGVKVPRGQDISAIMNEIGTEMKERVSSEDHAAHAPSIFLFVHGLHKFKKLRQEDDFSFSMGDSDGDSNPAAQFNDLITEGSGVGMHIITSIDTYNNVNRCISRKALSEFEMRVVFQMSANDSASLIESPKASNLGLHRAIFYNEQEGALETFRPYAMPNQEWLHEAAGDLAKRAIPSEAEVVPAETAD